MVHYIISISAFLAGSEASLPLSRLLLSLKTAMMSSRGTASGKLHHDPNTDAAQVDSSEMECLILDTVSPPHKNALSTSVDVAGIS